ncbi:MAG: glycosyltransferase family 2 protein [Lachnospiraceae bacterium]|nr:glycosyltransferase family 2 protein [Lachnospiraceae bacterium]
MRLNLVMPMAGGGTRFENHGFTVPKPLIQIHGKPFFYWAVQSVVNGIEVGNITFAVLQEHIEKWQIDKQILEYYPESQFRIIPQVLNGALLTCLEGIKDISNAEPILFNDCDHAFRCEAFRDYSNGGGGEVDGGLLTFASNDPRYSYVKFDGDGSVCGTVEKEVVSNEAICGAYYFRNKEVFLEAADVYLKNCNYSEYFLSGVYNEMVKKKMQIKTFQTDMHISFGTPEEYEEALTQKAVFETI